MRRLQHAHTVQQVLDQSSSVPGGDGRVRVVAAKFAAPQVVPAEVHGHAAGVHLQKNPVQHPHSAVLDARRVHVRNPEQCFQHARTS